MVLPNLKWLILPTLYACATLGILDITEGKPTNIPEVQAQIQPQLQEPEPVSSHLSYPAVSRRLLASRTDENLWSASARLPTSAESGGNEHSRYKIRRDGSLSLALQHSNLRSKVPSNRPSSFTNTIMNTNSNDNINTRIRESPTELRSFSVVLSDVDVIGNYGKKLNDNHKNHNTNPLNNQYDHDHPYEDSYSEAGVSGYHLHSNSIHRMNASWKLNPSNSSPTSQELLEFLSLFTTDQPTQSSGNENGNSNSNGYHNHPYNAYGLNEVQRTTTIAADNDNISNSNGKGSSDSSSSQKRNNVTSSSWSSANVNNKSNADTDARRTTTPQPLLKDVHLIPFSTWSESSRYLKNEEQGQVDQLSGKNTTVSSSSETQVKPGENAHDNNSNIYRSGIGSASDNVNANPNPSSRTRRQLESIHNHSQSTQEGDNGMLPRIVLHDLISTLGKLTSENPENGTQTPTINSNGNPNSNPNVNRSRNSSSTDTEDASRMKPTDPNQTATDLKKLMDLLIVAQGSSTKNQNPYQESTGEDQDSENGASIVNIVITPNLAQSNATRTSSSSPLEKEKQKIVFLKSPQVKQLLDTALSDPTMNLAAQKIAAALHAPSSSTSQYPYRSPSGFPKRPNNVNINGNVYGNDYHNQNENQSQHKNYFSFNETKDAAATTPDGFPLTASGFLNLHHPNLQFHQALHHLVANGSSPTSINATTKTNVINIFVLNFNRESDHKTAIQIKKQSTDNNHNNYNTAMQEEKWEQLKQKQQLISQLQKTGGTTATAVATTGGMPPQQSKLPLKSPFANINPFLIEKVQQSPTVSFSQMGAAATQTDSTNVSASASTSTNANNLLKNNSWVEVDTHPSNGNNSSNSGTNPNFHEAMLIKATEESQTALASTSTPKPKPNSITEKNDRINILDLLPGDFTTFTKATEFGTSLQDPTESVDKDGGGSIDKDNLDDSKKDKIITFPHLPQRHDIQSHLLSRYPIQSNRPEGYNGYGHGSGSRDPEDLIALITSLGMSNSNPTPTPDSSISDGKMPSKTTEIPLPPELSHLSWIFNNEPPPKPLPLISSSSTSNDKVFDLPDYDDPDFPEESVPAGDATIIHPDESEPELETVYDEDYGVTTSRSSATSVTDGGEEDGESATSTSTKKPDKKIPFIPLRNNQNPQDPYLENIGTSTVSSNQGNQNQSPPGGNPPAATPVAVITNNNGGNNLRSRVRTLITALGYSALPTLAAGAAATWSYWVPLVATAAGRKRRSITMTMTQPQLQRQHDVSRENLNLNKNDSFIIKKANSVAAQINARRELATNLSRSKVDPSSAPKLDHPTLNITAAAPPLPDHAHQITMLMVRKPKYSHTEETSTSSNSSSPLSSVISVSDEDSRDGRTKINSHHFNSTQANNVNVSVNVNENATEEALVGAEGSEDEHQRRESLSKWIKVEVITESSPTSTQPASSPISTSTSTVPPGRPQLEPIAHEINDKSESANNDRTSSSSTNRPSRIPAFNNNGTIITTDNIEATTISSRTVIMDDHLLNHSVPQISHTSYQEENNASVDNKDPRRWISGQPSLPTSGQDVPLLKNFLKNVISKEWNISSTTSSSSDPSMSSEIPLKYQNQVQLLPVPLSPVSTIDIDGDIPIPVKNKNRNNSSSNSNAITLPKNPSLNLNHHHNLESSKVNTSEAALAYTMVLPPSKFETFKPSGQTVSIIIGQKPIRKKPNPTITTSFTNNIAIQKETKTTTLTTEPQKTIRVPSYSHNVVSVNKNKINASRPTSVEIAAEATRRKKQLNSIVEAEASYTSAALFPIWFPILFGNRRVSHLNTSIAHSYRAQN